MPLALLLSPDDQAVNVITSILEEMSVTCERPLDGVSAARKLHSRNFDLVLVDCENLAAAKLIFDVCSRGIVGKNPVPVGIVNGRAGLPTAFRLGAELILTKPVSKDQARNTIRSAVNRIRKEEPARGEQIGEQADTDADISVPAEAAGPSSEATEALLLSHYETSPAPVGQSQAEPASAELASAASASAESGAAVAAVQDPSLFGRTMVDQILVDPAPAAAVPMMSAGTAVAPEPDITSPAISANVLDKATPAATFKPSDDPVLAELERAESEPQSSSPEPVSSDSQKNADKPRKVRGPLVAVLALAVICAGLYAAWMTQSEFRKLVQPQVEQVLALVGVAHPVRTHAAPPVPIKPAAQTPSSPVSSTSAEPAAASQPAAANGTATPVTPSTNTVSTNSGMTAPDAIQSSSAPSTGAQTNPTAQAPATIPAGTAAVSPSTKADGDKTSIQPARTPTADSKTASIAISSDAELPGEKTALVLSSKGAQNRLSHSVEPSYPAHASGAEGTVVVKVVIDENGRVTGARAVEGNPALVESAVAAVKQWRYRPYIRDGKAVPFQTIVLIDFARP